MKIVLVFPPFYLEGMYNLPPLGLINLATALKSSHHQITLIDFVLEIRKGTINPGKDIYEHCARRILDTEYLRLELNQFGSKALFIFQL